MPFRFRPRCKLSRSRGIRRQPASSLLSTGSQWRSSLAIPTTLTVCLRSVSRSLTLPPFSVLQDMSEEAAKHGQVMKLIIPRPIKIEKPFEPFSTPEALEAPPPGYVPPPPPPKNTYVAGLGRVYIEYASPEQATKAQQAIGNSCPLYHSSLSFGSLRCCSWSEVWKADSDHSLLP